MNDMATAVLVSLAASGALTAALVFLLRTWISERLKGAIKHEYDQKLETYKAALQAEADTAIERVRADMRIAAFERETRFAKLHAQRAETIAELYARLQELYARVSDYVKTLETSNDPTHEVRREAINKALRAFNEYYRPRRIFLPAATEMRTSKLESELFHAARIFATGVEGGRDEKTGRDSWEDAYQRLHKEAEPIFDELKAEFRKLLGDEEASEPNEVGGSGAGGVGSDLKR